MKIPIINSKRQYETIAQKAEAAVLDVMRSGSYILGANNKELEREFCEYLDCNIGDICDAVMMKE